MADVTDTLQGRGLLDVGGVAGEDRDVAVLEQHDERLEVDVVGAGASGRRAR